MTRKEFLTDEIKRWGSDARIFARECLGVVPDVWQDEALRLVSRPETRRLAFKACKGPGKTAVLAWIILWFLSTRWEAKIGCTSITEANIDSNLWPELSKWLQRSAFLNASFAWTKSSVVRKASPGNWFAQKRTWPKSANAEQQANALAGLHADHVMFVLDESGGMPQALMVTAEAVLANEDSEAKVIQSGNPTHTTGPLYRACTIDKHLWEVVEITGDPLRADRSPRISLKWANEQIASYGRENPWVMVNVLGQFPPASINSLLGVEEVNEAMHRHLLKHQYDWSQRRLGIDVARFGDDRTVIFPRQGLAAFRPIVMRNARTTDIAARVMMAMRSFRSEVQLVDDTGHWGHGVIDNLITGGIPAIGINYAAKALNVRYKNRRAEMWLEGAKAIKAGAALPNIPDMVGELTEPTYTFVNGVFLLEEKDQIKERLGRSPDLADAYFLTYALPDMPGDMQAMLGQRQTTRHDGDPFELPSEELQRNAMLHDEDPFTSNPRRR